MSYPDVFNPLGCDNCIVTTGSTTVEFEGDGTQCVPLSANVRISEMAGNSIFAFTDGLYASGGTSTIPSTQIAFGGSDNEITSSPNFIWSGSGLIIDGFLNIATPSGSTLTFSDGGFNVSLSGQEFIFDPESGFFCNAPFEMVQGFSIFGHNFLQEGGNMLLGSSTDLGQQLQVTGTVLITGAVQLESLATSGTTMVVAGSDGTLGTMAIPSSAPGGSDNYIQYNEAGTFAASSGLTYDPSISGGQFRAPGLAVNSAGFAVSTSEGGITLNESGIVIDSASNINLQVPAGVGATVQITDGSDNFVLYPNGTLQGNELQFLTGSYILIQSASAGLRIIPYPLDDNIYIDNITSDGGFIFRTDNGAIQAAQITETGNVLIGTVTDNGSLLQIGGGLTSVSTSDAGDSFTGGVRITNSNSTGYASLGLLNDASSEPTGIAQFFFTGSDYPSGLIGPNTLGFLNNAAGGIVIYAVDAPINMVCDGAAVSHTFVTTGYSNTGYVFAATNVVAGQLFSWGSVGGGTSCFMDGRTDGVITFYDSTEAAFNLLTFGGVSASNPAIKASGTGLVVRLGDDSDYGDLTSGSLTIPALAGTGTRAIAVDSTGKIILLV